MKIEKFNNQNNTKSSLNIEAILHSKVYRLALIAVIALFLIGLAIFIPQTFIKSKIHKPPNVTNINTANINNKAFYDGQNNSDLKPANVYETQSTKIARSLDIPPMYPNVAWKEVTEKFKEEGLNEAWIYEENIKVSFSNGNYYSSASSVESSIVEEYYAKKLKESGWAGINMESFTIDFNSFKLAPLSADAPCAGAIGFIGYKDGFARLITIRYDNTECQPFAMNSDATPIPNDMKFYSNYIIYISEPTSINVLFKDIKIKTPES